MNLFRVAVVAVVFLSGLTYPALVSGTTSQGTCIGIGGWSCGYTGPFTGRYYTGYATLGCTPTVPNGTCVVPEIAMQASYLVIKNDSYVIDWANQSFRMNTSLVDGSIINLLGKLSPVFYNKTAGSTYMVYYSNMEGMWNPQPSLQIQNATLTSQAVVETNESTALTCETTLVFTVTGSTIGVWNPPMISSDACYTVSDASQHLITDGANNSMRMIGLASTIMFVVMVVALALFRRRKKPS